MLELKQTQIDALRQQQHREKEAFEKGYATKEKRERELLLLDAESRYKSFIHEFPHLEPRIKQHMIASYLGITPIALSRIRKKMGLINIG